MRHRTTHRFAMLTIATTTLCAATGSIAIAADAPAPGKTVLFDGKTLTGWTTRDGKPMAAGWVVEDGCLHRKARGGDIFTAKEYGNFIFELEWKVSAKGNSGIKYRYAQYDKMWNGPEYQVLDDEGHPDGKKGAGKRRTACLYDILEANTTAVYRKAGQWNTSRIVARGTTVEHWLNGTCVLKYDSATPAFKKAVQNSKFKAHADYGSKTRGRIMLQDHNDPVWYRNITITEMK